MAIESVESNPAAEARAVASLTLAFVRDPVIRWSFPSAEAYLEHFPGFARIFGGRAFEAGTAWMSDDDGGASLWLPPGVEADGPAIAEYALSRVEVGKRDTLEAIFEAMGAVHPEEPHWYLPIIGVDSAHQGKGLGSQLLQVALQRCDADGVIGYLESSNPANIPLYERHGFEVVAEIQEGDAPPLWPMRRPARA